MSPNQLENQLENQPYPLVKPRLPAKRIFDFILSLVLLVILSPLLLLLGVLVWVSDGWPILFFQERPGLWGKSFWICKFRTMKQQTKQSIAQGDEDRLTGFGKWMRSTSLDELPELWNVLKGDMSMVGPRPLLKRYLERFDEKQARRHEVRPGITGWAQVNGRNELSWIQKFQYDVWYVDNGNFLLDLKILWKTIGIVFLRSGISAEGSATAPEFLPDIEKNIEMSSADINENDIKAVESVLRSGRLALGPQVLEFERKMAEYIGVKHAIAVSSGTAALHLIVKSLGLGPGDEVLVPSFTFAASVNALLYEGVTPVFVDIHEDTYNLDERDLENKLTAKTRAIMVVDVFGHSADWDQLLIFAKRHRLKIIDDCCEALGGEYRGQKVGSFGDAGAFAFYPNKQITTGEGGMIVTDDDEIARLCQSYRNQGRDAMGQWLEHPRLGYNYRMDEMSGALGSSQMDRIESFVFRREQVASLYHRHLRQLPDVMTPVVKAHVRMSWFVYVIRLRPGFLAEDVIRGLNEKGIPSRAYFSPIHSQEYIQKTLKIGKFLGLPVTEKVRGQTIALPFHNQMTEDQVIRVVNALADVFRELHFPELRSASY